MTLPDGYHLWSPNPNPSVRYFSEDLTLDELDQRTATDVMDWHRHGSHWLDAAHFPRSTWEEWEPSRNMEQALQVMRRINARGDSIELLMNPGHIRVRVNYGRDGSIVGEPNTEAATICRAALIPLGIVS